MHYAARDTARHFGLRGLERGGGGILVTAFDGGFDLLHESADSADAGTVDRGAGLVAADALLGLRRIGHVRP